jgi:uncharacterized iron-regulated membrane protein
MVALVCFPAQAPKGVRPMKIHTHWLRVIHKWAGLIIGLQFLLWTLSGAMMALLDMEEVAGGERRDPAQVRAVTTDAWPTIRQHLGSKPITALTLRPLLDRQLYEVQAADGVKLFDAATGQVVVVDARMAQQVAAAAHPGNAPVVRVRPLDKLSLAVREHELPIWRVDFRDQQNSSYYVSATNGALLERRNDTWRLWDFFWMLHNMDYVNRTSFNHPLIIMIGFAAVWLAITGFYLLFRTGWRSDFKQRRKARGPDAGCQSNAGLGQ